MHGKECGHTFQTRSVADARGHGDHRLASEATDHARQRTLHAGHHHDHISRHHIVESREKAVQPGHTYVGDADRLDPVRTKCENRFVDHRHVGGTGRHHEYSPTRPRLGFAPEHRRVRHGRGTVRGFQCFALIFMHTRNEHRARAVLQQFGHYAHALLGRLTGRVHSLGRSLSNVAMMIDERITHIGERQPRQPGHGIIGRYSTRRYVVEKRSQAVDVHVFMLTRRALRRSLEAMTPARDSGRLPRVGFFGPFGTFTEQAVRSQTDLAAGELIAYRTVPDVLDAVAEGAVDVGVVPIENSIEGTVNFTQDALAFDYDLLIQREIVLDIEHCLLARPGVKLADITEVLSIPVATAQCHRYLRENIPNAEVRAANSTADAAKTIGESKSTHQAAVAPRNAAALYGLDVLAENIEDHHGNQTRFLMIGRGAVPAPSGHDRTGVVVYQRADEPGSLISILQEFAARRINMNNLFSRPTKDGGLGDYCFIIYFDGHVADELVADALRALHAKQGGVKFLGSYPASGAQAHSAREHADARWQQADDWVDRLRDAIATD